MRMSRKNDSIIAALLIAVLLVVVYGLVGLTPDVMASSDSATPTSTLEGIPGAPSEAPLQVTQIAKGCSQPVTVDNASQVKQLAVSVWRSDPSVGDSPDRLA